jgi:UDP-N-acetylglucosamine 2-epimerase (non-hydrolysing)
MIKLAPLIQAVRAQGAHAILVNSGQHADLLHPLFDLFGIQPDHDLAVMAPNQALNTLTAKIVERLDPVLASEQPDYVIVQGDTATAMAGALAAFNRKIPVAHVEAGLRSGNALSPFPEEMNRRVVGRLSSIHFAATAYNRDTLLAEGVPDRDIHVTGNTVVDALFQTLSSTQPGEEVADLRRRVRDRKLILLTTHRRENFGDTMRAHLRGLRQFAEARPDLCIVFPVHPNPAVREATVQELMGCDQVILTHPLGYADFVHLLSDAWLIVSDSGGIQEEAASLGKPILVLRENTERPEGVHAGVARLAGERGHELTRLLEEAVNDRAWFEQARQAGKVYGDGRAAERIAQILVPTPATERLTA